MTNSNDEEVLENFITGVKCNPLIDAIILYGSKAMGTSNEFSDIDVIVCCSGTGFYTPVSVYKTVAQYDDWGINPVIKSTNEFRPDNWATMSRRYIKHLKNVGEVVYSKNDELEENITEMWEAVRNNSKIDTAYKISPALRIRHNLLELFEGKLSKVLNDENQIKLPKELWQNSMDVLEVELSPIEETKIIEIFYGLVYHRPENEICGIREDMAEINKKLKNGEPVQNMNKEIMAVYVHLKTIIEKDVFALNNHINKH